MTMPIDVILDKAKASGFDSELAVAAILRKSGWSTSQSVYYIDKDEDKGRELDMLAYKNVVKVAQLPHVTCGVSLCIEVKKTKEPFIFFSNAPGKIEGGGGYSILKWLKKVDSTILPYKKLEDKRPFSIFKRISRSYTGVKSEAQIKSGILSAFKAAVHWSENADETYSSSSFDIFFYIPLVVVDGPIYDCFYAEDGNELTAEKVDRVVYLQNYRSPNYGDINARVNVISIEALESVLEEYRIWIEDMHSTMVGNLTSKVV